MAKLTPKQLTAELSTLDGWEIDEGVLCTCFDLFNFVNAMGFVNSVALLSERANHHPEILIQWNKVTILLSTHSEGGITEKDFQLAREIEEL